MNEVRRILDQLKRVFAGNAWHGPSVKEVLSGVSAEHAAARPLAGAHTIWEIVLHMTAWTRAGTRMLTGEDVKLKPKEDWPAVSDQSAAAWERALQALELSHNELQLMVAGLNDSRLDERVPGRPYSVYFLIHGLIQHDLYHAGQIAILRKGLPVDGAEPRAHGL